MDQRFHRLLHLGTLGRHHLAVGRGHRPLPFGRIEQVEHLLHDADRLAHLVHANQVAVVAIAVLADRHIELEPVVALVGLRLAQVPGIARAAHHHAGKAPLPGILGRHHADIGVALHIDAVAGQQLFEVVEDQKERVAERTDVVDQRLRQILVHPTRTEIGRMHAAARGALIEDHQLLALVEPP